MVYMNTNPNQIQLLPTNLREIIDDGHICYLIEEVVGNVNFSNFNKSVSGPGAPSYHPRIKLKILIYGILERETSSRRLEKLTKENIVFRYLAEGTRPDFHTLAMFRKEHPELIERVFVETIFLAKELNLINSNRLYLDGTKMIANASKKKNYSEDEINFLLNYIRKHLKSMDRTDKKEDKKYASSNGEITIPEHLKNKRKLKDAINNLKKNPIKAIQRLESANSQLKKESSGHVNLSDPDSKLMRLKVGNTYKQAFNCQLVTEDKSEIILSTHVSNTPTDVELAIPTVEKLKAKTGFNTKNAEISMDNGYMSLPNLRYFESNKINAYIPTQSQAQSMKGKGVSRFHVENFELDFEKNQVVCPEGKELSFIKERTRKCKGYEVKVNLYKCNKCQECGSRANCIKGNKQNKYVEICPESRRFSLNFSKDKVQKVYKRRFHKGEVAQAHILHNLNIRSFVTKSIDTVQGEFNLMAIAYNIVKIHKKKAGMLNPTNRMVVRKANRNIIFGCYGCLAS